MRFTYPKRLPEANVQAQFYMRCKQEGIPCLLEYRVKGSRFDAVIHDHERVIFIIEIKSLSDRAAKRRESKKRIYRQIERYESHGAPVIVVMNGDGIEGAIKKIKERAI